jgi:hypothetical protein
MSPTSRPPSTLSRRPWRSDAPAGVLSRHRRRPPADPIRGQIFLDPICRGGHACAKSQTAVNHLRVHISHNSAISGEPTKLKARALSASPTTSWRVSAISCARSGPIPFGKATSAMPSLRGGPGSCSKSATRRSTHMSHTATETTHFACRSARSSSRQGLVASNELPTVRGHAREWRNLWRGRRRRSVSDQGSPSGRRVDRRSRRRSLDGGVESAYQCGCRCRDGWGSPRRQALWRRAGR